MDSSSILEVRNLSLVFGQKPKHTFTMIDQGLSREVIAAQTSTSVALRRVSLDVYRGEILVVMGLSGSGKSSLLRCINGLNGGGGREGTLAGTLTLRLPTETFDLTRLPRRTWRRVRTKFMSMVFQQPNLLPWLTVGQNIGFPLKLQGLKTREIDDRVDRQLALIGLTAWKNRKPHELSGGMQQRVGLARALITDSPMILMDEPFSALDPLIRSQLQKDLVELNQTLHKTILFISHDIDEAMLLGSRIALMEDGVILQIDTARELIFNPKHPSVRRFTAHAHPPKDLAALGLKSSAEVTPSA